MFKRIHQYNLIDTGGRLYRPRAYGDPRPDGTWDGWLVFFPLDGGEAIATEGETTQASLSALTFWAAGLTPTYLEGAMARALRLARQSSVIDQLADAEYEALADAEQLETAAEIERARSDIDERAAAEARAEAERLRSERLATQSALAEAEVVGATESAELHEEAAQQARSRAADAARRSGHGEVGTARKGRSKKPGGAKKK